MSHVPDRMSCHAVVVAVCLLSGLPQAWAAGTCGQLPTELAEFQLRQFMAIPFQPISDTKEGRQTLEFDVTSEPEMRRWFLHQIRLNSKSFEAQDQKGDGYMIYAGLEDGTFSGYGISDDGSIWYTERKPGKGMPAQYNWSATADIGRPWETSTCARGITCRPYANAHGCAAKAYNAKYTSGWSSSCRAHSFTNSSGGNTTCPILAACKVQKINTTGQWEPVPGRYLARNCSHEGNNTNSDSTSTGYAAARDQAVIDCGHTDCVASPMESCEDGSHKAKYTEGNPLGLRVYYDTERTGVEKGAPVMTTPARWRLYDPRARGWYKGAKTKWIADNTRKESWSSLYLFASGQGMGLTALRTMDTGGQNPDMIGVLAVDYSLGTVRGWLQAKYGVGTESEQSTAVYVVDRNTSMLLGWSSNDTHVCSEDDTRCPHTHPNKLVSASALHLERVYGSITNWPVTNTLSGKVAYRNSTGNSEGTWPQPSWLASTDPAEVIRELHIEVKRLEDKRGLNWLVVVAQVVPIVCESPTQPDAQHLHCECKPGYRTLLPSDSHADQTRKCIMCKADLGICGANNRFQADGMMVMAAEECIDCAGGNRVYAKPGYYLEHSATSLSVYRCSGDLCAGTCQSQNQPGCEAWSQELEGQGKTICVAAGSLQSGGNCCLKGHSGPLCAMCSKDWAWSDDRKCVPCEEPDTIRIAAIFNTFLMYAIGLVLTKHFHFKLKKSTKSDGCRTAFPFIELQPLGLDLPQNQGPELQTLTFWLQTFSMLELEETKILQLVLHFSFTKGSQQCLFAMDPGIKFVVDVLGPPLYLLVTAVIVHYTVVFCYYKAHRYDRGTRVSEGQERAAAAEVVEAAAASQSQNEHLPGGRVEAGRSRAHTRSAFGTAAKLKFEPHSAYLHKLKSVAMDIAILQLMPMLLKSTQIMHCRRDTPDGKARVVSMPLLVCEGVSYNIVWWVALMCFCLAGFVFPTVIIYQLRARASAPTVEMKSHSLFVGDIDAQHGTSTGTSSEAEAQPDPEKLKKIFVRFMTVASKRDISVNNGSIHHHRTGGHNDARDICKIRDLIPVEPGAEVQAEHILWLLLTQHYVQHQATPLKGEHVLHDNFCLRTELCEERGGVWACKDEKSRIKLMQLGLTALLTLILIDEFQKSARDLVVESGAHSEVGQGPVSVQLQLRVEKPSWAVVTFKTHAEVDAIMATVITNEGLENLGWGSTRKYKHHTYYMERHHDGDVPPPLQHGSESSSRVGVGKPLLLSHFSNSRARAGLIPIDKNHPAAQAAEYAQPGRNEKVRQIWQQAQKRLESACMRSHVKRFASSDVAVGHLDVRGKGRHGRLLLSPYWATRADGSVSRRDWISIMYAGVEERVWWWSGLMLFRRTAVAVFSSRREGQRFEFFGTSADWRCMVVVVLVTNVFLSTAFLPFESRSTNYYSDLSLLLLIMLYVLWISQEANFFTAVFFMASFVLFPAVAYLLIFQARKVALAKKRVEMLKSSRSKILAMGRGNAATSSDAIFEVARNKLEELRGKDIDDDGDIALVNTVFLNKAVHASSHAEVVGPGLHLPQPSPPERSGDRDGGEQQQQPDFAKDVIHRKAELAETRAAEATAAAAVATTTTAGATVAAAADGDDEDATIEQLLAEFQEEL